MVRRTFRFKIIWVRKIFLVQVNCVSKTISGPKKFLVQNFFWPKQTLGSKKILGQKRFWVQKNFGSNKILGHITSFQDGHYGHFDHFGYDGLIQYGPEYGHHYYLWKDQEKCRSPMQTELKKLQWF